MGKAFWIWVICGVVAFVSYQVLLKNDNNVIAAGIAVIAGVIGGIAMTIFLGKLGGFVLEKFFGKNKISKSWK